MPSSIFASSSQQVLDSTPENNRILIIDDDPGIRNSYQEILSSTPATDIFLKGDSLFGDTTKHLEAETQESYTLSFAENGEDGVSLVEEAVEKKAPFAVAFVDMKMPGIDGAETARRILKNDPNIKIVIVTAFTEYTPDEIVRIAGRKDLFYLRKPFNSEEIRQFARALVRQWFLEREREFLALSLIDAHVELLEKQERLDEDALAAAQIQQSLIPHTSLDIEHFQFAWQFMPCQQIGGDIFNVYPLDESHVAAYVVDVSGHGVPSAMVTVSVSQSLLPQTDCSLKTGRPHLPYHEIVSPAELLDRLDREYPTERFDKYFTIVYFVLNVKTGHIRYGNAAHPLPVLVRSSGEIEVLDVGGPIIGMGLAMPFEEGEICMQQGDRLFLYTDGIVECENQAEEFYGEERLYQKLQETRREALDLACQHIIGSVKTHAGDIAPQDDITLLAIEYQGSQ